MKKRQLPRWILLLGLVLFLSFTGLLFVFEASTAESYTTFGTQYHFLLQHSIGLAVGLVAMMISFFVPTKLWIKFSPIIYILSLLLIILTLIPGVGVSLNGARRWFSIGGISFQAVEFLKFGVVVYFANWMSQHQKFLPFVFLTAIPALLLLLQPDLGSLLLVVAIATCMYFLSGGSGKNLLIIAGVGIPLALMAIFTSPYRMQRLTTFLNPESDPLGASFHIRQITLALGQGGIWGKGIGNSNQKYSYIPEASTDSIFAIISEEIGFVGATFLLGMIFWYLVTAFKTVSTANISEAERLLGFGIVFWIGLQTLLNISAVVALIPLTGMPLPFFSYGRSSQVMILFASGILIRIGKNT